MKVLVIGDSCKDIFVYGDIERICPEAPVPIINPKKEIENGGMALNVVSNLESLGVEVDYLTNITEIEKVRYVDNKTNQMLLRVDKNDECERCNLDNIVWDNYDIVVISDYNKGFLTKNDISNICKLHNCVFIDTKKELGSWIHNVRYIKLNQYEYKNNKDYIIKHNDIFKDKLIVTYGERGCYYQKKLYKPKVTIEVKDVCGAGDTFLAGLIVHMLKHNDIEYAIDFAQECASEVVSKKGVVVV